jgi:hypothetical protein
MAGMPTPEELPGQQDPLWRSCPNFLEPIPFSETRAAKTSGNGRISHGYRTKDCFNIDMDRAHSTASWPEPTKLTFGPFGERPATFPGKSNHSSFHGGEFINGNSDDLTGMRAYFHLMAHCTP